MAGRRLPRLPFGLILWAMLALLLALGLITTVMDLIKLPHSEVQRANDSGQRVIIDPTTGAVSVGSNAAHNPTFDVGTAEDEHKPADATTPSPTEEKPAATEQSAAPAQDGLPSGLATLRTEPTSNGIPPAARGPNSLVNAPAPEITEAAPDGSVVPRRGDKNATASDLYAHQFTRASGQHLLAFIIVDAGLDAQSLPVIMGLPPEVSVAVSPYARNVKPIVKSMRNAGHEVWVMVPMVGDRYPQDDPGPLGLIPSMPADEVIRRLHEIMSVSIGSVGMVLPPSEALSKRADAFRPILDEIDKRGLYVLSTHPTRGLRELTGKDNPATVRRADLLLDANTNDAVIESKLAGVLQTAASADTTIVVATARPQTVEILRKWFDRKALGSEITLAPVSAMYRSTEKAPEPEGIKVEQATKPKAAGDED